MPAHHLNALPASQISDAVLAVLAGTLARVVAEHLGVDETDLEDAIGTYRTAGHAALEQRAAQDWCHVRVQFADWTTAEAIAARELGPRLCQLEKEGTLTRWWFLRKHPCWRLRLHGPGQAELAAAVTFLLGELATTGQITCWTWGLYEPETAAFGGPAGIHVAHDLFCADSRGILDYLRQPEPLLGRRETSVLLASAMMGTAGLDWFERADVFYRVGQLRPALVTADLDRASQLSAAMRKLLAAQDSWVTLASGMPDDIALPWISAFEDAGRELRQAAATGTLQRGLRPVLTHLLIFHWNRLGLSAASQSILAHAARIAIPPDT